MFTAIAPDHALVTVSLVMTPRHQPSLFIDSVHICAPLHHTVIVHDVSDNIWAVMPQGAMHTSGT